MWPLRVVVPSWSRLSPDLESETGCQYAALIPLGGKPLYQHIIAYYSSCHARAAVHLVLPKGASNLEKAPESRFDVILLEHSSSIATTVLAGLESVAEGESVVIHMADTLIQLDGELKLDTVYTNTRRDLYRWTSVVADVNGFLDFPCDRKNEETQDEFQEVCVGVFSFSDACRLRDALRRAISYPKDGSDPFFSAIREYSREIKMHLRQAARWFDCGHVDTYYESRLGYQNLRHFNSLRYDPVRGQVTKTSLNEEQFRHQVRWYKQVPDALSAFLPRIYDSSDGESPFITMELLSISTLSDIFVTARLAPGAWNGVVRTIAYILDQLSRHSVRTTLASELARSVYVDKTRTRIEQFLKQDPLAHKYKVVSDAREISLLTVLSEIDQFVECAGLLDVNVLCPIHGDFCFSNLLFDPKVRLVKLIDPRGEFGVPGIYGDARYDLAKLSHSFCGGYDFIVSDRFSLDLEASGKINFQNSMGPYHEQVKHIFETVLLSSLETKHQVSAIEALLFLSMLPLHVDAPKRQLAMLATGLSLFDKVSSRVQKK